MKGSFRATYRSRNGEGYSNTFWEGDRRSRTFRGSRKPKPSAEAEEFAKEEVTEIVTEEPEFEMPGEETKIPQLKPCYFQGKLDNHFEKFVEVVHRLSINMPLLDAFKFLHIHVTSKTSLQINMR
jgi:hypothetical protein